MKRYRPLIALIPVLLIAVPWIAFAQGTAIRTGLSGAATAAGLGGCSDQACVINIIGQIIGAVLGLVGIVLLVLLLYGGYVYMTAGGSPEDVKKAKAILTNAIIGLVIITLAYTITGYILTALTQSMAP